MYPLKFTLEIYITNNLENSEEKAGSGSLHERKPASLVGDINYIKTNNK